jgi:hypothetical protein
LNKNETFEGHSCARIKSSSDTHGYDIIVVAGTNDSPMSSVEILDLDNSVWRAGPELPIGVSFSSLVEDRAGGVVLVGGYSGKTKKAFLTDQHTKIDHDDKNRLIKMIFIFAFT